MKIAIVDTVFVVDNANTRFTHSMKSNLLATLLQNIEGYNGLTILQYMSFVLFLYNHDLNIFYLTNVQLLSMIIDV